MILWIHIEGVLGMIGQGGWRLRLGSQQRINDTSDELERFCEDFGNLPDISLTFFMEIVFLNSTQRNYFHKKSEAYVRQVAKVFTEALQLIRCVISSLLIALLAAKFPASCQFHC